MLEWVLIMKCAFLCVTFYNVKRTKFVFFSSSVGRRRLVVVGWSSSVRRFITPLEAQHSSGGSSKMRRFPHELAHRLILALLDLFLICAIHFIDKESFNIKKIICDYNVHHLSKGHKRIFNVIIFLQNETFRIQAFTNRNSFKIIPI